MSDENDYKLLIIDDDINIINLLSKRLSQEGFQVIAAQDGKTGLDLALSENPNIILLDLLMPVMSGKEVLKELKSQPATALIPVIIVSAVADIDDKIDGLSLGANDYIVKPFRFQEVIARINTQLRISSMHKDLEQKHNDLLEKNKLLKKLAVTDPLTSLFNKGYMIKRLRSEVSRSARYKEPLSIIMFDLDFFKKINDTHGHTIGDQVLKHVSQIAKEISRNIDVITRYGGEEFIIICPNTNLDGTLNLAERLRFAVETTPFVENNLVINVTISVGVKCSFFDTNVDPDEAALQMIDAADTALYSSKAKGRNVVQVG